MKLGKEIEKRRVVGGFMYGASFVSLISTKLMARTKHAKSKNVVDYNIIKLK